METLLKVILAIVIVFLGFTCSIVIIKKNRSHSLNRLFGLFFLSSGVGFCFFVIYHSIFTNMELVRIFMIITNISLNFSLAILLTAILMINIVQDKGISKAYIIFTAFYFFFSVIGYFIWSPWIDESLYPEEINTITPPPLLIYVTIYRLSIIFYIIFFLIKMVKYADEEFKQKLILLSQGLFLLFVGAFLFLVGNIKGFIGIILEIIGEICIASGLLIILMGMLKKKVLSENVK